MGHNGAQIGKNRAFSFFSKNDLKPDTEDIKINIYNAKNAPIRKIPENGAFVTD
jgi:hypothetical protein